MFQKLFLKANYAPSPPLFQWNYCFDVKSLLDIILYDWTMEFISVNNIKENYVKPQIPLSVYTYVVQIHCY